MSQCLLTSLTDRRRLERQADRHWSSSCHTFAAVVDQQEGNGLGHAGGPAGEVSVPVWHSSLRPPGTRWAVRSRRGRLKPIDREKICALAPPSSIQPPPRCQRADTSNESSWFVDFTGGWVYVAAFLFNTVTPSGSVWHLTRNMPAMIRRVKAEN